MWDAGADGDSVQPRVQPGRSLTDVTADLSLTGERTLPGIWHENYWVSATKRCATKGFYALAR